MKKVVLALLGIIATSAALAVQPTAKQIEETSHDLAGYEWMCVKANECNESLELAGYLWECRDDRCWTAEKREAEVASFLWSDFIWPTYG